jgi:hypothetical protein
VATSSLSDTSARRWDRAGIAISMACAIRCAALPLVAGVLPAALAIEGLTAAGAHWANIHLCRCGTRHQASASVDASVESRQQPGGSSTDCAG